MNSLFANRFLFLLKKKHLLLLVVCRRTVFPIRGSSLSLSTMVEIDDYAEPLMAMEDEHVHKDLREERSRVFEQLKPHCLELLELLQRPKKHSSVIPSLRHCLRSSSSDSLQPFFESDLFLLQSISFLYLKVANFFDVLVNGRVCVCVCLRRNGFRLKLQVQMHNI